MPCHPTCPGFLISNVPDDALHGIVGGSIERCDGCRTYEDLEAMVILWHLGVKTKSDGRGGELVSEVPARALPALRLLGLVPSPNVAWEGLHKVRCIVRKDREGLKKQKADPIVKAAVSYTLTRVDALLSDEIAALGDDPEPLLRME